MEDSMRQYKDYVPLLLRIGVGLIFIIAGWGKLTGIEGTAQFFGNVGIPLATFSAWLVAIVEFFGGIMVLLGLYTRISAALLAFIMLVAILTVKIGMGWDDMRLDFTLLIMSISLLISGDGRASVGEKTGKTI